MDDSPKFSANQVRKDAIKANKSEIRKLLRHCDDPSMSIIFAVAKLHPGCDVATFDFHSTAPIAGMKKEMNCIPKKFSRRLSRAISSYLVAVREETGPNSDEVRSPVNESGFPVPSRPVHDLSSKELDKFLPEVVRYVCEASGAPTTGTMYASLDRQGVCKPPTLQVPGWLEEALPRENFYGPSRRFAAGNTVRRVKLLITDFMLQHGVNPIKHCRRPASSRPKNIYTTRQELYEEVERLNVSGREAAQRLADLYGLNIGRNVESGNDVDQDSADYHSAHHQIQIPNHNNNNTSSYNQAGHRVSYGGPYNHLGCGGAANYPEEQSSYTWFNQQQ